MDTSNLYNVCCINQENIELKGIIERQTNEISKILREKEIIHQQYIDLIKTIDTNSLVITSNIDTSNVS